jgi:hypothetical protein
MATIIHEHTSVLCYIYITLLVYLEISICAKVRLFTTALNGVLFNDANRRSD